MNSTSKGASAPFFIGGRFAFCAKKPPDFTDNPRAGFGFEASFHAGFSRFVRIIRTTKIPANGVRRWGLRILTLMPRSNSNPNPFLHPEAPAKRASNKFRAHWRAKFAQVFKFRAFSTINRFPRDRKTPSKDDDKACGKVWDNQGDKVGDNQGDNLAAAAKSLIRIGN